MKLPFRIFGPKTPPSMLQFGQHGATSITWGAGFGWLSDVTPAAWIGPRLHPFGQDVGSVIPEGFEAYARLFHPVEVDGRQRWGEIARRNDRIVHAQMQFHLISTPRGETPTQIYGRLEPRHGTLLLEQRRLLVDHLREETITADRCWFAMWEGFGGLNDGGVQSRIALPHRRYLLYGGAIERALESPTSFDLSPNLWWPDDRAWFVTSEIDFAWTLVGGRRSLISTLVSDSRLEALPIELNARVDSAGDRVNAALNG